LQNKLNVEYVTCDKLKDTFNTYICGFAHMNKLGNWCIEPTVINKTNNKQCRE